MKNLTDAKVASLKGGTKRYPVYDGDDLWLMVYPSGRKTWTMILEGKQTKIGAYPLYALADARQKVLHLKRKRLGLANAADKGVMLKDAILIWYEEWRKGKAPKTEKEMLALLENHVVPLLGNYFLKDVTTDHVEDLAINLQAQGLHATARYVLIYLKKIYRFKPIRKLCQNYDPVSIIKASELLNKYEKSHRARIPFSDLPQLIQDMDAYPNPIIRTALQLMLILWVRNSELLGATRREFDFKEALWRIPPERMKMKREHVVPLSRQAINLLTVLFTFTEKEGLFFPENHVQDGVLLNALYDMGYKGRMTVHGFRGIASTKLNEKMWDKRAIEAQLSHIEPNASAAAYNSSDYLDYRREMMQFWSDYIDDLRKQAVSV